MTTSKNDGTNVTPNPYMDYKCAKGRDSDGVPYDEYDFTPPALNAGDRYLRTLVDTRNNTLAHIAIVVKNKHECSGNLVAYITTRRGLFIHRLLVAGEEVSFICAFPDEQNPERLQQVRGTSNLIAQRTIMLERIYERTDIGNGSEVAIQSLDGPINSPSSSLHALCKAFFENRSQAFEGLPTESLYPIIEEAKKENRSQIDEIPKYVIPERDPMGKRYDQYVMTQPQLQNGDTWLGTAPAIDKRECTVNHLAKVAQGKYGPSGVLVNYACNSLGQLLKREVLDERSRVISKALTKAVIDPERPNLDFDGDDKPVDRNTLALLNMFNHSGMTLDEAKVISDLTDPEQKVKAMEAWLAQHGGMDRINEATLSRTLFGPAPGSALRRYNADIESAQRLCQPVVINEMNYGRLAVSHINGVPFVGDIDDLCELGLPGMYISKTPKFNRDICIRVTVKVGAQENVYPFYCLEKEDINDLGMLLSKGRSKVAANFMAADLKVWVNGTVEREYTSPEEFFACNADWIERAKF